MNFPPSKPLSFLDMRELTAYLTICRSDCNLPEPAVARLAMIRPAGALAPENVTRHVENGVFA
ncbi:hypothetical protein B0E33_14765 [Roseibium algicola]|jgi:hypothetical protein|uniref:Uncharacterized protein n=1 Tax=Roseibium algicola TaxID=2857014 RepID=A0ABM6I2U5_9HYPH|nr:hypothetical protein ACP90_03290 [Labrenzia sp. CP4]AQQ04680.1 hypothetical protein B0E33_14765 [Roseibium aggregatum]ERP87846.1 hypothetical protein Q669_13870 [Labrenzia sp. C1B10]ERS08150.1 hypothetical protein Q675_22500 [Labrenzia sp. C1B70]